MGYVATADVQEGCIFCTKPREQHDEANGILVRARHNYLILNAFPYNSGHLMIVPYRHESDFAGLPPAVVAEMFALAQLAVRGLQQELHAEGANLGMNVGKAAGAGIKDHLHLHLVPRWSGDTNYMTTTAQTRVVPQSLEETWRQLHEPLQRLVSHWLTTQPTPPAP